MKTSLSKKEHRRRIRARNLKESLRGLLFLTPWIIGVLLFVCYPVIFSFYLSFQKIGVLPDGSGLEYTYIGLDNFKYAFLTDNVFPVQMFQFMFQSVLTVPIIVIFSLLVALMLNQRFPGRMLFRAVFFLPVIFATGQMITELFNQGQASIPFLDQYNVADTIYTVFNKSIADTIMAILEQFVIILWYSGIQVIIYMAAFQTISPSTYEAAKIDGVTPWESFWKITFPAIVPFIVLNMIYTIVDLATFPFNPILEHIAKNMSDIKTGYGYASALGWIYMLVIFVPIALLVILSRKQTQER